MSQKHSISAVIPCYNAGAYLREAIESVLAQSRPVDEILIVDDGSTDDSPRIAEEYARRCGVRVIRSLTNCGNAAARNLAIRQATGDLLAWLDADDVWEPWHIEQVAGLLEQTPLAAAAFGAVRLAGEASGTWEPRFPPGQPVDAFWDAFWRSVGPQMAAVIRRDALRRIGGYDESMRSANDYEMFVRLARAYPLVCTHDVTAAYRWHQHQLSRHPSGQYRNTYRSRLRLRDQALAAGYTEFAGDLEASMRWIWRRDLEGRWRHREMDALRFTLGFADLVPAAPAEVRRHYACRAWIPRPALRLWDVGPLGAVQRVAGRLGLASEPPRDANRVRQPLERFTPPTRGVRQFPRPAEPSAA
ncbi:MAG TPA: glycosyltransferase family 2 protein [Gemmatimonadales bacterium]|nr:glycosyltransferase family 2 protein [Gemmatimonadales bacterium]